MENKNYKNKIIKMSGEPVSGKGTVTKVLIEKLKEQGYEENKIHLIGTGDMFRRYFAEVLDLMSNFESKDKVIQLDDNIMPIIENKEYRKKFIEALTKIKTHNIDISNMTISQYT